jgi:RimJ/RimL family protein N-acetyltransferase
LIQELSLSDFDAPSKLRDQARTGLRAIRPTALEPISTGWSTKRGSKSWWGKGVVNETREALLDEFFNNRGIEKVVGMPFARNFPAVLCAKRE